MPPKKGIKKPKAKTHTQTFYMPYMVRPPTLLPVL